MAFSMAVVVLPRAERFETDACNECRQNYRHKFKSFAMVARVGDGVNVQALE
jgi:hypothetical protein